MDLKVQPRAAIEKLHEELRLGAVFLHVGCAEEIFRIARQQLREIPRRGIEPDPDLRDAFRS